MQNKGRKAHARTPLHQARTHPPEVVPVRGVARRAHLCPTSSSMRPGLSVPESRGEMHALTPAIPTN